MIAPENSGKTEDGKFIATQEINLLDQRDKLWRFIALIVCEDHQAIFEWQRENIAPGSIIRSVAYQVPEGWYIKTVFKRQEDAMAYHRYVHPNEPDHFVPVFRDPRAE